MAGVGAGVTYQEFWKRRRRNTTLVSSAGGIQWLEPMDVPFDTGASAGLNVTLKSCAEGTAWEGSVALAKANTCRQSKALNLLKYSPGAELCPITFSAISHVSKAGGPLPALLSNEMLPREG